MIRGRTALRSASPRPRRTPAALIATGCGIGLLPYAPGTWASLAALPIAWAVAEAWGTTGLALAIAALLVAGTWAAARYIDAGSERDPPAVVIDEIAGQCLVFIAVPIDMVTLAIGFLLFRTADIAKPWPASWADRRLRGGIGAMADDVIAAAYALAAMHVILAAFGPVT